MKYLKEILEFATENETIKKWVWTSLFILLLYVVSLFN